MSKNYIRKNRKVYNEIADEFSQDRQSLWNFFENFKDYINEGDTILDLGCGNGRLYQLFEENQVNYIGIDQSEELIDIAQTRVSEGKFFVSDMKDVPLQDNFIDTIFCIATFHHLPDRDSRRKALSEMKRVLKPGGSIIMTNWNTKSNWFQEKVESGYYKQDSSDPQHFLVPFKNEHQEKIGIRHYWEISQECLSNLAQEVGIKVEEQKYIDQNGKKTTKQAGMNLLSIFEAA